MLKQNPERQRGGLPKQAVSSHVHPIIKVMAAAKLRCPICKKEVSFDDPNMPFCSDRCRLLDLGNWASEKYVISTPAWPNELEESDEPEPSEGSRR
jgi:uncharacterized protein